MKSNVSSANTRGPVVLVSREIGFTFPLSYAYLAGHLKSCGEDVRILFRRSAASSFDDLVRDILALKPVLVGFGNLYPELEDIRSIIADLDASGRNFPVVIGGQMVSPIPEFAVTVTGADVGVIGEGEIVLHQVVTALREGRDVAEVGGLAIRQGDSVILTGLGEYFQDLSDLPPVPYELFPTDQWLPVGRWYAEHIIQPHWRYRDRVVNVHGGRGCPYRCNFCYHHSKPRYRALPQMMAEAAEGLKRFDATMLYFSDDLAVCNPRRAEQLACEIAALDRPVDFSVSARFDILDRMSDELLQELSDRGCRVMGLGIESGSDRMLKIIGKNCTSEVVLKGLQRLRRVGIIPTVSIMVGQDSETRDDVEASISLMRESVRDNPNIFYPFTIATPFPGSSLYDLAFEKGLLTSHREFYDMFFPPQGQAKGLDRLLVNFSAMSDQGVFDAHRDISLAYREAKAGSENRTATRLGRLQLNVGRAHRILVDPVRRRLPSSGPLAGLGKAYDALYGHTHVALERARLKRLGLLVSPGTDGVSSP